MDPAVATLDLAKAGAIIADMIESRTQYQGSFMLLCLSTSNAASERRKLDSS